MSARCRICSVKWAFANGLCRGCVDSTPIAVVPGVPVGEKENSGLSSTVGSVSLAALDVGAAGRLSAQPSAPPPRAAPKFKPVGPPKETCTACSGTVYAAEKAIVRSRIFHVTCLKCTDCNKKLTPGTVDLDAESRIFCNIHFQQRQMAGSLTVAAGGSAALEMAGGTNVVVSELGERYEQTQANAKSSATGAAFGDTSWQKKAKQDACKKCGETVYLAEKMETEWKRKGKSNKQIYHKACFRCLDCSTLLRAGQYEMCPTCDEPPQADLLCKAHFAERLNAGRVLGTPQYTGDK
mmetsp:Transcript_2437/g.4724  ORF Transcript_2437/g.4724 Transcript_2437/m.4724 type:complete len:295 (-) Transcript_2437:107-991(-)|eukprot:CAMPEP_0119084842 /NCGR_PEP_ID=MMETSP1178-20130426/131269_1 /TAXON_ID=33656 /ORGANISM="unid sp, Strain CCMP2000" /LENGTH=294 /DNA_ID=CAMNT_0007067837 /DNA_START=21 /DNA_END=905 /DNA_ORIENTATION=+